MRGNAEASIDAWAGHRFVRITPSNALSVCGMAGAGPWGRSTMPPRCSQLLGRRSRVPSLYIYHIYSATRSAFVPSTFVYNLYIYLRGDVERRRIAPRNGLFWAVGPFSPPPGRGCIFRFALLNLVRAVCRVASIMDATRGGVRNRGAAHACIYLYMLARCTDISTVMSGSSIRLRKRHEHHTFVFAW